jgi:hypothetical protein
MDKINFELDKSIKVPPGKKVFVDYVPIECVILDCKDPMAIGDVQQKYELIKQNSPSCIFPTPIGYWEGERFHIVDGRHTFVGYLLNGYRYILVTWLEQ